MGCRQIVLAHDMIKDAALSIDHECSCDPSENESAYNVTSLEENYPTTMRYQPQRGANWNVVESEPNYVLRMQGTVLPHWPEEVLREWLYRHPGCMEDYAFLGFGNLRFEKVFWETERIPGKKAFRDESFCDNFQNVEIRAAENSYDWLAHYMLREGTWNTPIVLLESQKAASMWIEAGLKTPYHLLEGHRRLSFLQGLKRLNGVLPAHPLWIVKYA
jgi:hypothetical protein